jgi:hypothetical protein
MCAETVKDGKAWSRVKETEANCPDPSAPPPTAKNADDDDAEADAMMQKMIRQGQDFIEKQKRK